MTSGVLRLATRGSPLALAQAHLVRASLADAHGWDPDELEELCPIITFKTMGDRIQDRPLVEAGGKGLFVKEIEEALLNDEADIAVHSMKDMPGVHPAGLTTRATCSSRAMVRRSTNCRRIPGSAPVRCGGRRKLSGCGQTSKSCPCGAMSKRGC